MAAQKLDFNFLGKSGIKVSNLCLGTMTFGMPKPGQHGLPTNNIPEDMSFKIMDKFEEVGGNFIDTADFYTYGASEEIVGKWLAKRDRSRFVVATKQFFPMSSDGNQAGSSRRNIISSCNASLERLQTSYIDLYQTHCWDMATPIEESLRAMDDLIRAGKVHYFGVSNVCGWQMQQIVDKIEMMGLNKCVSLQQQYSLLERQSEFEEFMVCRNNGIGVLPWSPLKGGMLTGKYSRDKKPDIKSGRIGVVAHNEARAIPSVPAWSQYENDQTYWNLMDHLSSIAKKKGKSMAQVAIRWLLQKDIVASVIIGATSPRHVEENAVASSGWELTKEEMDTLDSNSPRQFFYPYTFIYRYGGSRINSFNNSLVP